MTRGKAVKAWAGFTDGRLFFYQSDDWGEPVEMPALFKTKSDGEKCFEDIRRVEIRIIERAK